MIEKKLAGFEAILLWIVRIVVGVLFILSGFSKLIDPHGLEYKMQEFCEVLGWSIFDGHHLLLSVCMIAFEIIAGAALLLGFKNKLTTWLLLLLTLFFTFLTAYALFNTDKIKECGCFGGCIKLTNEETFWKDVALTILIIYLLFRQQYLKPIFSKAWIAAAIMIAVVIASFGWQAHILKHGALIDCLPYKVGNNISLLMQKPNGCVEDSVVFTFVYKKGNTTKCLTMDSLSTIDSTWTFIERKDSVVRKGNCDVLIKDFRINAYDGQELTSNILSNPNTTLLYIAENIEQASNENVKVLSKLTDDAKNAGIAVLGCSASDSMATAAFVQKHQLNFGFSSLDATVCKTIIRSNSGLLVLKNGVVIYKCSSPDFPVFEAMAK